jgi:hypothetical protein
MLGVASSYSNCGAGRAASASSSSLRASLAARRSSRAASRRRDETDHPYECIWRPFFDSCHQPEKPNFSKLQNGVIAQTSHQVQPFQPVQMPMLSSVKPTNDAVESLQTFYRWCI